MSAIPSLAGLATYEEAMQPGLGVDENVDRLRRFNYAEGRLYQLCASFMNPTPEWEVKCSLSLHLYLDGEHSQALRTRVAELRRPPLYLDKSPDERLTRFFDEVQVSRDTSELLTAVFGVVRPALLEAYRRHLGAINPLFDFPTVRILKQIIAEEEQMIEWGMSALAAVGENPDWELHLRRFLSAAGGIDGLEPVDEDTPPQRATVPFVPEIDPKRDARSGDIYNFNYRANDVYEDPQADMDERVLALMFKRFHEMDVPEMMASIIVQTKGKPWEYYRDMGRQLWDEARHSMMGEVWFAKQGIDWTRFPNHVGWSMHLNLDRTPLERHIILYYIEQNLMDGKTGKKLEWQIAQSAEDEFATYLQDYDWADEVLHAQIGRRWLKPEVGDVKVLLERGREIAARPSPTFELRASSTEQRDWWPEFVEHALGKPSTASQKAENAIVPKFERTSSG
jgi:hypothetical protein